MRAGAQEAKQEVGHSPALHRSTPTPLHSRDWQGQKVVPTGRRPGGLGTGQLTSMLMKMISMSWGLRNRCRGFMKCCARREKGKGDRDLFLQASPRETGTRRQSQRERLGEKDCWRMSTQTPVPALPHNGQEVGAPQMSIGR